MQASLALDTVEVKLLEDKAVVAAVVVRLVDELWTVELVGSANVVELDRSDVVVGWLAVVPVKVLDDAVLNTLSVELSPLEVADAELVSLVTSLPKLEVTLSENETTNDSLVETPSKLEVVLMVVIGEVTADVVVVVDNAGVDTSSVNEVIGDVAADVVAVVDNTGVDTSSVEEDIEVPGASPVGVCTGEPSRVELVNPGKPVGGTSPDVATSVSSAGLSTKNSVRMAAIRTSPESLSAKVRLSPSLRRQVPAPLPMPLLSSELAYTKEVQRPMDDGLFWQTSKHWFQDESTS